VLLFCQRQLLVISDISTGNFDVLLANIGILTASSFALSFGHFSSSLLGLVTALLLGLAFLANQIDETFSNICLQSSEEHSSILVCLYAHLSHLIFCSTFFVLLIVTESELMASELFLFSCAY